MGWHQRAELWRHCMAVYHGREPAHRLADWLASFVGLPWPKWARTVLAICKPPT